MLKSTEYTVSCKSELYDSIQHIRLSVGGITHFTYPKPSNNFRYKVNENFTIKPECDGIYCSFYSENELPKGIEIDNKTGIISGYREEELSYCKIKIICKNEINEMDETIYIYVEKNDVKKVGSRFSFDPNIAPVLQIRREENDEEKKDEEKVGEEKDVKEDEIEE